MAKSPALIAAFLFSALAIVAKLKWLPLEANFAVFGALFVFCGAYLRGWWCWGLPTAALVVSDLAGQCFQVAGVHLYDARSMLFNYLGFAVMGACGHLLRYRDSLGWGLGAITLGSLAFFLISNFGSWLDPVMQYEPTTAGLIQSYVMGWPFFRNTLASDLLFFGLFYGSYRLASSWLAERASQGSGS